jgi:hypothetical protein
MMVAVAVVVTGTSKCLNLMTGEDERCCQLMRLLDLELCVERQLRDLPDAAYLLAMSVIGKYLAETCDGFFPAEVRLLAGQTVDAVKAAYRGARPAADDLVRLHQRWDPLLEEDSGVTVPQAMFHAMDALDVLVLELAGKTEPHFAASSALACTDALAEPVPPSSAGPRLVLLTAPREADESSPEVQLLRKFEEVARLAASQHRTGLTCDPYQIYAVVFG